MASYGEAGNPDARLSQQMAIQRGLRHGIHRPSASPVQSTAHYNRRKDFRLSSQQVEEDRAMIRQQGMPLYLIGDSSGLSEALDKPMRIGGRDRHGGNKESVVGRVTAAAFVAEDVRRAYRAAGRGFHAGAPEPEAIAPAAGRLVILSDST